jgi:hypothetical protein
MIGFHSGYNYSAPQFDIEAKQMTYQVICSNGFANFASVPLQEQSQAASNEKTSLPPLRWPLRKQPF